MISNSVFFSAPPELSSLITFLAECPCWCDVQGVQYYDWRIYFWGFNVYIFVDLVKGSELTLVGEIQCYKFKKMAEVNHTSLPVSKKLQFDGTSALNYYGWLSFFVSLPYFCPDENVINIYTIPTHKISSEDNFIQTLIMHHISNYN